MEKENTKTCPECGDTNYDCKECGFHRINCDYIYDLEDADGIMTLVLDNGIEIEGFFDNGRIDKNLPNGYAKSEIRYSDNYDDVPATLEKEVKVNFYGSFIYKVDKLLNFTNDTVYGINDWSFND